jgi:hypothetical protein
MKTRIVLITIIVLCNGITTYSQTPIISISPDSISMLMQYNQTVIDSFTITNTGSDTLKYHIGGMQYLDTTAYKNAYINYSVISSDSTLVATIIKPLRDFVLYEIRIPLLVKQPAHFEYFVYAGSSQIGSYTKIYSRSVTVDSLKYDVYLSSGSIDIKLNSSKYYALGVCWDDTVQYHYKGNYSFSSDGFMLQSIDHITRSGNYPSDSILTISEIQTGPGYDVEIYGAIGLWIKLLSDSTGYLTAEEKDVIKVSVTEPGFLGIGTLSTVITVYSNDPHDTLKNVVITRQIATEAKIELPFHPIQYDLKQNYPNPFNSSTTIPFSISDRSFISINIYDVLGRIVAVLVAGNLEPGVYHSKWDANNVPSGIYFYRLKSSQVSISKKMILLK